MSAYYNEIDPHAAQWLRNLIAAGHIADGVVDERSIDDVQPNDLREFTQCHFFAGIGVWSYALRRAGWGDDRPVWTGSCPCQPFSQAGAGAGFDDERHLWPSWQWLIEQCRPSTIFGEQVSNKDAEPWLDLVSSDMEAMGFAFGAIAFPSAGIGAPHIRDRTYFVAYSDDAGPQGRQRVHERAAERSAGPSSLAGIVADADRGQFDGLAIIRGIERNGQDAGRSQGGGEPESRSDVCELADSGEEGAGAWDGKFKRRCTDGSERASEVNGFWRNADWISCRDGKWRPVEPGTFPLVDGTPARVGRLRAYGNAINAEAAAQFIRAAIDCR